jgi:glycerol-3-phosphate dehydrogenase
VPDIEIISGEEMRQREPLIRPDVVAALWAPTGAISDPFAATVAAAENAVMNGVELMRETAFEDFLMDGTRIIGVRTTRVIFSAAGRSMRPGCMPMRSCIKLASALNFTSSRAGVNM